MERIAHFRSRRLLVLACATGIVAALILVGFSRGWHRLWCADKDANRRFPPGVLADYVPEDSEAVMAFDLRSLRESSAGRRQLEPALQQLLREGPSRMHWIDLLGINPLDDLDYLLISFAPAAGKEPLWLARGRFDPARFQCGSDKLREKNVERIPAWEYVDRTANRTTRIVPLGDEVVVSDSPERVLSALKQASDPHPLEVRDADLRQLLAQVDRRQTLWLAASLRRMGSLNGIDSFWLRTLLRPMLAHADRVQGGLTCADDVRASLRFGAVSEDEANALETNLTSIRDLAREGGALLTRQKELLPLLRLLGAAEIVRDGRILTLRSRMNAD